MFSGGEVKQIAAENNNRQWIKLVIIIEARTSESEVQTEVFSGLQSELNSRAIKIRMQWMAKRALHAEAWISCGLSKRKTKKEDF